MCKPVNPPTSDLWTDFGSIARTASNII